MAAEKKEGPTVVTPCMQILIACRFPEVTRVIGDDNQIFMALRPNGNDIRICDLWEAKRIGFKANQHFIFIVPERDVPELECFKNLAESYSVKVDIIVPPKTNKTAQLYVVKQKLIESLTQAYALSDARAENKAHKLHEATCSH